MIGKFLKQQREFAQLSQCELAKRTGIKQANISRWENDVQEPQINTIIQLAKFYNITVDELIGFPDTTNSTVEHSPAVKTSSETAAFVSEFADIIREKNFVNIAKLYKAAPKELRAIALGYLIGLMSSNGVNTQAVLGY